MLKDCLRPLALKLFSTQSSHGKIGKQTYQAEQWTLEIIKCWPADNLSGVYLLPFTYPPKIVLKFTNSGQKSVVVCLLSS